jgi:hypothetical protein
VLRRILCGPLAETRIRGVEEADPNATPRNFSSVNRGSQFTIYRIAALGCGNRVLAQ